MNYLYPSPLAGVRRSICSAIPGLPSCRHSLLRNSHMQKRKCLCSVQSWPCYALGFRFQTASMDRQLQHSDGRFPSFTGMGWRYQALPWLRFTADSSQVARVLILSLAEGRALLVERCLSPISACATWGLALPGTESYWSWALIIWPRASSCCLPV